MDFENLQKKSMADLRSIAGMMQLEVPKRCTKAQLLSIITGMDIEDGKPVEKKEAEAPKEPEAPVEAIAPETAEKEEAPAIEEAPAKAEEAPETETPQAEEKASAEGTHNKKKKTPLKRDKNGKLKRENKENKEEEQAPAQPTQEEAPKEPEPEQEKEKEKEKPQLIGDDAEGLLEVLQEGYGFIRTNLYFAGPKDVFVNPNLIRRFGLKQGDYVTGKCKAQRDNEKYPALFYVTSVNGLTPEMAAKRLPFESLTPVYPDSRITLETAQDELSTRLIDLIAPIGKGQRGMIVSPPKAGKTVLLKKVANAITTNHPKIKLMVLLIDERPEEVTDMRESIQGEVISSTFDEMPEKHIRVAEMVFERAKRLVESGEDVVILMDSLTRLARAYNITITPTGRSLSGGLDPGALYNPKRFFGAARNIRGGGSLTIVATALIDTGSKMDDVIFEEFKGTGNMELHLDRKLSEKRIFPAIDINKSGTRKEELLLSEAEMNSVYSIRKALSNVGTADVTEMIVGKMLKTKNNEEFIKNIKIIG